MKYLIFADGRKIPIQSLKADEGVMHIRLIQTDANELKSLFDNPETTKRMVTSENGWESEPYENYTIREYIKEETGGIWEVEMRQTEADTGTRMKMLEEKAKVQDAAIKELDKKSVDQPLFQAAVVVARANAQILSDQDALRAKVIYPTWQELADSKYTAEKAEYKFTYGEDLYKTIKAGQTFEPQWIPGQGTESIFTRIDEIHSGTQTDPIPWHTNMQPELGKYYVEDSLKALCIEDPGQALQNRLTDLCPGRYFQEVSTDEGTEI